MRRQGFMDGLALMTDTLRITDLQVTVASRTLLQDVHVEIPERKITVLVGGSGAGKSVLLRILAGLAPRNGDPIRWSGSLTHADGRPIGRTGVVFQQFALFDELSPTANVQFAIDHRDASAPTGQTAREWLTELRVPAQAPVAGLSGGQKQRLAVARTLGAAPEIVLYDEPTSGLDAASSKQVADLIRRTSREHGQTVIVVTHDYENLLGIADQVCCWTANRKPCKSLRPSTGRRFPCACGRSPCRNLLKYPQLVSSA